MSNIPTDALHGSPSFTFEVKKLESGEYEVSTPGTTVPPTRATSESDAINAHSRTLFDAVCSGTAFATNRDV